MQPALPNVFHDPAMLRWTTPVESGELVNAPWLDWDAANRGWRLQLNTTRLSLISTEAFHRLIERGYRVRIVNQGISPVVVRATLGGVNVWAQTLQPGGSTERSDYALGGLPVRGLEISFEVMASGDTTLKLLLVPLTMPYRFLGPSDDTIRTGLLKQFNQANETTFTAARLRLLSVSPASAGEEGNTRISISLPTNSPWAPVGSLWMDRTDLGNYLGRTGAFDGLNLFPWHSVGPSTFYYLGLLDQANSKLWTNHLEDLPVVDGRVTFKARADSWLYTGQYVLVLPRSSTSGQMGADAMSTPTITELGTTWRDGSGALYGGLGVDSRWLVTQSANFKVGLRLAIPPNRANSATVLSNGTGRFTASNDPSSQWQWQVAFESLLGIPLTTNFSVRLTLEPGSAYGSSEPVVLQVVRGNDGPQLIVQVPGQADLVMAPAWVNTEQTRVLFAWARPAMDLDEALSVPDGLLNTSVTITPSYGQAVARTVSAEQPRTTMSLPAILLNHRLAIPMQSQLEEQSATWVSAYTQDGLYLGHRALVADFGPIPATAIGTERVGYDLDKQLGATGSYQYRLQFGGMNLRRNAMVVDANRSIELWCVDPNSQEVFLRFLLDAQTGSYRLIPYRNVTQLDVTRSIALTTKSNGAFWLDIEAGDFFADRIQTPPGPLDSRGVPTVPFALKWYVYSSQPLNDFLLTDGPYARQTPLIVSTGERS